MSQKTHRLWRKILCHLGSSEQRWPVLAALFGVGALYTALPPALLPVPDVRFRWVPLAIVLVAALPLTLSHRLRMHRVNTNMAYVLLGILTLFLVLSLYLVVKSVSPHAPYVNPVQLLKSAAILWGTNVIVFACWYWRLDAGGPNAREKRDRHEHGAFLFPQMTMSPELLQQTGQLNWKPGFVDYVFLAFSSSTALSPTDSPVLSKWAKWLMMLQSTISFTVIVLLAARAVNILPQNDHIPSTPKDAPAVTTHSSQTGAFPP